MAYIAKELNSKVAGPLHYLMAYIQIGKGLQSKINANTFNAVKLWKPVTIKKKAMDTSSD